MGTTVVSRVAVCLPKDRSTDDGRGESGEVDGAPGGGWLAEPLKVRLTDSDVVIGHFEARFYWLFELRASGARFVLTIDHTYPFACRVWLWTRRSILDRLRGIDHAAPSDRVFGLICDVMRADQRSGRVLVWRGGSEHRGVDRFVREATTELNGGVSMPGVVRLPSQG